MVAKFEDILSAGVPAAQTSARDPAIARGAIDEGAETVPPTSFKNLLSAGGVNIFVLSTDTELIDTVDRACGEHYSVFPVRHWNELELAVESGRCGVALLDAQLLGDDLVAPIKALQAHSNRVVTLAAAERSVAQDLMGFLSDRSIHRLLIKPPALGITRLLIESAVSRFFQLRESAQDDDSASEPRTLTVSVPRGTRMPAWVLVGTAVALAAGVAVAALSGWWLSSPDERSESLRVAALAVSEEQGRAPQPAEQFAELLSRAEQAVREGRLAAPPGHNALDYYLTILEVEPTQEVAREQLGRVLDALFAEAEEALRANTPDSAAAALTGIRRADPTSSRLALLDAQLERSRSVAASSRQAVAADRPQSAPLAAESTELDSLLSIAALRLRRGQLLDPPGDSAQEYINRATQLGIDDRRLTTIRAQLATALVGAARVALEKSDLAVAEAMVDAARGLGAEPEALASLTRALAATREQYAGWLAAANQRLQAGALLEPAGDSAIDNLIKLQSASPDFVGLGAAWEEFVAAASSSARAAIAARNWRLAETTLTALQQAPQGSTAAAPLSELLEAGRLEEQYLAVAVPVSELTLLESVAPRYPADAKRRNVEGWVEIEFVVDAAGRPKDLVVVQAEPQGRFDRSAMNAVEQYRYAPFEHNGRVFERRVRLRLRFTLR